MSIILFLIILFVLILVHEFGHFITAKWAKIRVDEFAIGFPPKIFSWKRGETQYSLNLLPFGGFVKIFGENPAESEEEKKAENADLSRSFGAQSRWVQSGVLVAGIFFNALLAWVLFSTSYMIGLPTSSQSVFAEGLRDTKLAILDVAKGSPANVAGLEAGDRILAVSSDGENMTELKTDAFRAFVQEHKDGFIDISYERVGETRSVLITPASVPDGGYAVGIMIDEIGIIKLSPPEAIWQGLKTTGSLSYLTIASLSDLISGMFNGKSEISSLTGPVGIVGMVGEASKFGFAYLLSFAALISVNLAVLNLMPFPALDGGRFLFVIIEGIRGKAIKPIVANTVNLIGFAILIILMLVVTYHDIARLIG
jgi:regulator of sigma E protease